MSVSCLYRRRSTPSRTRRACRPRGHSGSPVRRWSAGTRRPGRSCTAVTTSRKLSSRCMRCTAVVRVASIVRVAVSQICSHACCKLGVYALLRYLRALEDGRMRRIHPMYWVLSILHQLPDVLHAHNLLFDRLHDVKSLPQVDGMLQPAGPPLDVGSSALNAAEAAASAMAAGGEHAVSTLDSRDLQHQHVESGHTGSCCASAPAALEDCMFSTRPLVVLLFC